MQSTDNFKDSHTLTGRLPVTELIIEVLKNVDLQTIMICKRVSLVY